MRLIKGTAVDTISERAAWFARARAYVSWAWLTLAVLTIVASLAGAFDGMDRRGEIFVLLIGALVGLPHGALDHRVAQSVYGARSELVEVNVGQDWMWRFLLMYLSIATLVGLLWWAQPVLALLAFLLVSAVHFGAGDVVVGDVLPNEGAPLSRAFSIAVAGGAIILIPWMFHPQDVATLFSWITQTSPAKWAAVGENAVLRVALVCIGVVWLVGQLIRRKEVKDRLTSGNAAAPPFMLEVIVLVALFATVKPLIAFSLYFGLLHAPRHTLVLAARLRGGEPSLASDRESGQEFGRDIVWVLWQSLPLTLIAIVLAITFYAWLVRGLPVDGPLGMSSEVMVRVIFWGLAALTFPHMWLTWQWESVMAQRRQSPQQDPKA
jgi:beta-carotene 15,15'-dioxygenase